MRGWVEVGGLDDAPVPWPYVNARGRHSPILCSDLVRAVKVEASIVVCRLFGVTAQTVTKWRMALAVPHANEGTSERIAAPKRGVERPRHVLDALLAGRQPPSAETRAKMGTANRRNGNRPCRDVNRLWSAREDAQVGKLQTSEAAKRTRRTLAAVRSRRRALGLPDGRAG
jgi:hypothetical protein